MVSATIRYLFYQPMDEKIKAWLLRFPAKENPYTEKALFDWPIVLQCDVKAKYRLISRKFSGMKFCHPSVPLANKRHAHFCIRSIKQSNRSISVLLLFLFCSRVSIQGHTKIALSPKWRACSQANVSLSTNTTDKDCHKQRYLIHICEW